MMPRILSLEELLKHLQLKQDQLVVFVILNIRHFSQLPFLDFFDFLHSGRFTYLRFPSLCYLLLQEGQLIHLLLILDESNDEADSLHKELIAVFGNSFDI